MRSRVQPVRLDPNTFDKSMSKASAGHTSTRSLRLNTHAVIQHGSLDKQRVKLPMLPENNPGCRKADSNKSLQSSSLYLKAQHSLLKKATLRKGDEQKQSILGNIMQSSNRNILMKNIKPHFNSDMETSLLINTSKRDVADLDHTALLESNTNQRSHS